MEKSFMSISMLIVSISMLALLACSSVVQAQTSAPKVVSGKNENAKTAYTFDETSKSFASDKR